MMMRIVRKEEGQVQDQELKRQGKSDMDLLAEVDATVKSVCKTIQERNMPNGEYASTVKALAALVEARTFWLDF